MNLYLDTEFNGHGGELISLALAAPDGRHWYGLFSPSTATVLEPWVAENVAPLLREMSPTIDGMVDGNEVARASLREFLLSRGEIEIYADWPDDFAHLMRLMSGPSYPESWMAVCTMHLIVTPPGEPQPRIPHNALSDAVALMQWHQSLQR